MPALNIHDPALDDLRRLRDFLRPKDRDAAKRAIETIKEYIYRLQKSPCLGSPYGDFKRLIIPFGQYPYIAFYHFDEIADVVNILRIIHSREDIDFPSHRKS